jgi:hypothetical protein
MLNRLTFSLDHARVALLVLVVGTLANGFYFALYSEFVPEIDNSTELAQERFLGYVGDLHSDLISPALALPPFTRIDATTSLWPYPYRKFAIQNHYHTFDLSGLAPVDVTTWSLPLSPKYGEDWEWASPFHPGAPAGLAHVTEAVHLTPLTELLYMCAKRLVLARGPGFTVDVFYMVTIGALAFACVTALPTWSLRAWVFFALALSYPFLQMLLRGNLGALITGFSLIFFIYLLCRTQRYLLAAMFLALACAVRPNAVVLVPLFLAFGLRRGIVAGALFLAVGLGLTLVAYKIDQAWYPGYSFHYSAEGLKFYYRDYVLGEADNPGNNSIYGAIKLLGSALGWSSPAHPHVYDLINRALGFALLALDLVICWFYLQQKFSRLEFAFLLTAIYMLASSVFATYHLDVFLVFPLLLASPDIREISREELVILWGSVFVLMPKLYVFAGRFTPDSVLNPLVVLLAVAWLLFIRARTPAREFAAVPA